MEEELGLIWALCDQRFMNCMYRLKDQDVDILEVKEDRRRQPEHEFPLSPFPTFPLSPLLAYSRRFPRPPIPPHAPVPMFSTSSDTASSSSRIL